MVSYYFLYKVFIDYLQAKKLFRRNHRDITLEQQQIEKIEIEVRDVDWIQITNMCKLSIEWPFGRVIGEYSSQT